MENLLNMSKQLDDLYHEVKNLMDEASFGDLSEERKVLVKTCHEQLDLHYELVKQGQGSISDLFIVKLLLKNIIQNAKTHEC